MICLHRKTFQHTELWWASNIDIKLSNKGTQQNVWHSKVQNLKGHGVGNNGENQEETVE
jgi:hypothetical protein